MRQSRWSYCLQHSSGEMRSMIRVLTAHGKIGKEILQEVNALYGMWCMRKTRVYEWRNMFLRAGHHYETNARVQNAILTFFHNCTPDFSMSGIERLVLHYNKCLDLNGSYVEK